MRPVPSETTHPKARPGRQHLMMRLFDIGLSLVLLLPVLPLLALALPGSVREQHTLRGRGGSPFIRWHLRLPQSVRGRLLRKLRVDRAPVLFNILKGQMSWVGPRPVPIEQAIPPELQPIRDRVRPGIYSLWTLRQRTSIDYEDEWHCDAEQLAQQSPRHDLGILARSLLAGIYGQSTATDNEPGLVDTVRIHPLTMGETLDVIEEHCAHAETACLQLCFVNPDCVNIARRNARYRRVINQADLVVPDGIGMRLAGRILKHGFRQNVNGTDLFPRLCQRLNERQGSMYLLGGQPGVADATAEWIRQNYPEVIIAGTRHGFFSAEQEPALIEEIRAAQADVLLVAMGAPRQELWIHEHGAGCGVRVAMGVGGLFDFYAGRIPRAPRWLREVGGEWLYRLYQEPRRMWRRYLVGNFTFMTAVLMQRWLGSAALAHLETAEAAPVAPSRARRAVMLMDFPQPETWLADTDETRALLPLGDRPLLYRSLETLADLGCSEVQIYASRSLARIRQEVGDGQRWGVSAKVIAVKDFNDAKRRIGRLRMDQDESIWLLRGDHWLPAHALHGSDSEAVWLYPNAQSELEWAGWALINQDSRSDLLAALGPDELLPHRLPEQIERIGAQAPVRFDQPRLALAAQQDWLNRPADAFDMLKETEPGIRIAPTAKIAPGARLHAPLEIGENSVIGRRASLGPNVVIGSECRIEGEVEIRDSLIADRVALRGPAHLEQSVATPSGLLNSTYDVWLPAAATGDLLGPTQALLPDAGICRGERVLALGLLILGAVPAGLLRTLGRPNHFSTHVIPGLPAVIAGRRALIGVGDDADLPESVREAGWAEALALAPRGLIRPRDALQLQQAEAAAWADVHWLVQPGWRERLRLLSYYLRQVRSGFATVPPQ